MSELLHRFADLGEVRLHFVSAGQGDPVLLLHGWPQTWYEWRHVLPGLAKHYRVIAPDLRGLGDSSRPAGGYDKATVANDVWRLLHDHLGIARFFLVGHDWGGPTAFALAGAHRDAVRRLAILDVAIPGDGNADISQAGRRWHHAFHRTPDLPEALIQGRERLYLSWFFRNYTYRPDAISETDIDEYVRTYAQLGAIRAGLAYYRAVHEDVRHNEELLKRGKLAMPVLALGGNRSWGRRMEVLESCRRVAEHVEGGVIEDCGHFMPEEQPGPLLEQLLAFFAGGR